MSFRNFLFRLYRAREIKKHQLDYLFWECTLKCNLNCLHCGSDCTKDSDVPDMPVADFVKVLDDIKINGKIKTLSVCITGGEPLIRKDIEVAGREIISRGYNWGIVTNGMLFTAERFVSLLNAGMRSMSFSIDGFEEQHTYLRQNPVSYKKVTDAIDVVVDFQKSNPNYFLFDVITCVHKKNLKILKELRNDLIRRGVVNWRIFSIFPEGRAGENDLSLSPNEYKELMDFIAETRKYRTKDGKFIRLNYSCEGYLGDYELKVRDFFFFCRAGINVGSVMCDGSISACLSVRSPDFIQGNIYDERHQVANSFSEIWNNRYQVMRDRNWARQGKCRKCKKWKHCLGNGMHLHHDRLSDVAHCNYELLK